MNLQKSNHGDRFTAKICGCYCEGIISYCNDNFYLCNNETGSKEIPESFGYHHVWSIGYGTKEYLRSNCVEELCIFKRLKEGDRFQFKYDSEIYHGIITVENGSFYLCQDVYNGYDCKDKKGYCCSWVFSSKYLFVDEVQEQFKDFKLLVDTKASLPIDTSGSMNESSHKVVVEEKSNILFKKPKKFNI